MTDPWVEVAAAITAVGGYAKPAIERAKERGVPPEVVMDGVLRALRMAMERGPYAEDPPFEEYEAIEPGSIDLRVFDQDEVWVDVLRTVHRIDDRNDVTDEYLTNLIAFLKREAGHFAAGYWMAFGGDIEAHAIGWLETTVLMKRLREEGDSRGLGDKSERLM